VITSTGQVSLFAASDGPAAPQADVPRPAPPLGMLPATARLVVTTSPDRLDREQRPLVLLVVACPHCDHQHVHPAGHPDAPRMCPRRSRCVGRPAGAYYSAVQL
jgi:hypothetical protein